MRHFLLGRTDKEVRVEMRRQTRTLERELPDPYRNCETVCRHDLVRAVTMAELHGPEDGPYGPRWMPVLGRPRSIVLDDGTPHD